MLMTSVNDQSSFASHNFGNIAVFQNVVMMAETICSDRFIQAIIKTFSLSFDFVM